MAFHHVDSLEIKIITMDLQLATVDSLFLAKIGVFHSD